MSIAGFLRPHTCPPVNTHACHAASGRLPGFTARVLPRYLPGLGGSSGHLQPWPATTVRAVVDPASMSPLLLSSIQEFRDFFRGFLLPGFAILTFTAPTVLLGLLWRIFRSNFKPGDQLLTVVLPPPQLNQQTAALAGKLLVSILIDLVGDGSFLVPGAGEGFDFLWAPVSALLIRQLYGSNVLGLVAFLEELLPFTDIIPTATLAFVLEVLFTEADKAERQGQGREGEAVIDVQATAIRDEAKKQ